MKPTKTTKHKRNYILGITKYVFLSPLKALMIQFLKKLVAPRGANFLKKIPKTIELIAYISNGHLRLDHTLENFG
jgi:hypothetical protein